MRHNKREGWLDIYVIRGVVLGVNVYRGFAKISDLSKVSKADIFNKSSNPLGTQRSLNKRHAKEAYDYIKNGELTFWPEVFLCARDKKVLDFISLEDGLDDLGILYINTNITSRASKIAISRVDGNHRLHLAGGIDPKHPPLDKIVSFCIAYNLTRDEEIKLFKDININQKAMETSHLDKIQIRLSSEDELKVKHPDLYIAEKLGNDSKSPLYERVHEGGEKVEGSFIPLHTLRTGISLILSRSSQISILPSVDMQYKVIRNYFSAVKKWQPEAWHKPKDYLTLRGAGLWAICQIGANVIDNVLVKEKFDDKSMLQVLESGKDWDWRGSGSFKGLGGRSGAAEISKKVIQGFSKKSSSILFDKIMEDEN